MTRSIQLLTMGVCLALGFIIPAIVTAQPLAQTCAPGTTIQPSPPYNLPARFSYAAKFVCGIQDVGGTATLPPPSEPPVKRGNYATAVNIHNPQACTVTITKKVALSAPETFPNTKLIPPTKRVCDTLPSDHAMSIDCSEIVRLLHLNGTTIPGTFIEGFVVIDSWCSTAAVPSAPVDLDVVSVTSSDTLPGLFFGFTNPHHDVTPVQGKQLTAGLWPF